MKTKRVRPVLVESTVRTNIWWSGHKLYYNRTPEEPRTPCYELVFISLENEKIEEGDWKYNSKLNRIWQHNRNGKGLPQELQNVISNDTTKVVARQSQISPEYISKFVEQYNNGCVEDLEIGMELQVIGHIPWPKDLQGIDWEKGYPVTDYRPKLTNGFVTIVEKEPKQYSNNLLCNMQYYMEYCQTNGYITPQDWLNNFKHYSDSKEQISYTEEEVEELIVGYDLYLDCCNEKENHPVGPRE